MKSPLVKCFLVIAIAYFLILMSLAFWQVFAKLENHPNNPRYYTVFNQARGSIYDSKGELLAVSKQREEDYIRLYTTPSLSHVVGYFHQRYGFTGLEKLCHEDLVKGRTLHTTLNLELQRFAEESLGDLIGAVVALEPRTGRILALVSSPAVDGNFLDQHWSDYLDDGRSPFLNRATQGLYPPGSLIKPLVYAGALEHNLVKPEQMWTDQGSIKIDNRLLHNSNAKALGRISTDEALAYSSNVVFAQLAIDLDEKLLEILKLFGLGAIPKFDLPAKEGTLPSKLATPYARAQLGIGQSDLLVSPLQMAMVVSTIANRGVMMRPYLVQELKGGLQMRQITRPQVLGELVSEQTALIIKDAMVLAVQEGTAKGVRDLNLDLAAKTGTAQVSHGKDHSWFMGFAPSYWPEVAVVVVIEHGGSGAALATPIGAKIITKALDNEESKKGKR